MGHDTDPDSAFDDAFRSARIQAGDDPSTLPDPYHRSSFARSKPGPASTNDDDDGGGGFIADDQQEPHTPADGGGGFVVEGDQADRDSPPPAPRPNHIPLSSVPDALINLGLDANDPDVLDLFASSAFLPAGSRRRAVPGQEVVEKVVGRDEFRQVARVLLSERGEASHPTPQAKGTATGRPKRQAARKGRISLRRNVEAEEEGEEDDSAEEFVDPDGEGGAPAVESELSDNDDDDGVGGRANSSKSKRDRDEGKRGAAGGIRRKRRKAASSPSPSDGLDDEVDGGEERTHRTPRLNPDQRDQALAAYQLFLDRLPVPTSAGQAATNPLLRRLTFGDIIKVASSVGEKLSEKDVDEMISVASTLFAPASSPQATRLSAQRAREAAAGAAIAFGGSEPHTQAERATVGIDEFAGVLVKAKLL